MIAGLDAATVSGWCLPTKGGTYLTGEWDFTPKPAAPTKGRGPEPEGLRFLKMYQHLTSLIQVHGIKGLILEQAFSKSRRASEVLSGFAAVVEVVCHLNNVEYMFISASTLKAFGRKLGIATVEVPGNKREETKESMKEGMRVQACADLGRVVTDNEADAYWLVRYYEAHAAPPEQTSLV